MRANVAIMKTFPFKPAVCHAQGRISLNNKDHTSESHCQGNKEALITQRQVICI